MSVQDCKPRERKSCMLMWRREIRMESLRGFQNIFAGGEGMISGGLVLHCCLPVVLVLSLYCVLKIVVWRCV